MHIRLSDTGHRKVFYGNNDVPLVVVDIAERVVYRKSACNLLQERDKRRLAVRVNAVLQEHGMIYS